MTVSTVLKLIINVDVRCNRLTIGSTNGCVDGRLLVCSSFAKYN